jgi:hypothetical protein
MNIDQNEFESFTFMNTDFVAAPPFSTASY